MAEESGGVVGIARLKVTPDSRAFGKELSTGLNNQVAGAGKRASKALSNSMTAGARQSGRALRSNIGGALDNVSSSASRTGSAVGTGLANGVNRAVSPIQRLKAGFQDSAVAASRFSGTAGTIGGKLKSGFTTAAAGAATMQSRFTSAASAAQRGTSSLGSSLKSIAGIASGVAVGSGILALGKQAFQTASDTQNASKALVGLTGSAKGATDMLKRMNDISRKSPLDQQTFLEAGKAMAYMGVSGGKATKVIGSLNDAIVAAGGSSQSMQTVTEALLNMQSQGKATAMDVNRISQAGVPAWEALAKASGKSMEQIHDDVSKGKVSVDDMMDAIGNRAGPTFKKLSAASGEVANTFSNRFARAKKNVITALSGMIEPVLAKLGPAVSKLGDMIQSGVGALPRIFNNIKSAMDSSGITEALVKIKNSAGDIASGVGPVLQGVFQGIGTTFGVVVKVAQPLVGILGDVGKWLSQNTGVAKVLGGVLGSLTGVFVAGKVAMAGYHSVLKLLGPSLTVLSKGAGAAKFAFSELSGNTTVIAEKWGKLKGAASSVGGAFATAGKGIASAAGAAARGATSVATLAASYGKAGVAAAANAVKLVAFKTAQLAVSAATKVWAGVQAAFNVVMNANPIFLIITAIAALVAGIVLLATKTQFFQTIWQGLQVAFQAVVGAIQAAIQGVINFFTGPFMAAMQAVGSFFSGIWNGIRNVAVSVWNAISSFFSGALSGFVNFFSSIWNGVRSVFSSVWNGIRSVAVSIWNGISGFFSGALNGFRNFFVGIWQGIVNSFSSVFGQIGGIANSIWQGVINGFKTAINWLIDGINWAIRMVNKVTGVVGIPSIPEIPHLAKGGTAKAGVTHLVGEEGPELFVPKRTGTVVPNNKLQVNRGEEVHEQTRQQTADTVKLARHLATNMSGNRQAATQVDDSVGDRVAAALSGWKVHMDSKGIARLVRDGNRRLSPTL